MPDRHHFAARNLRIVAVLSLMFLGGGEVVAGVSGKDAAPNRPSNTVHNGISFDRTVAGFIEQRGQFVDEQGRSRNDLLFVLRSGAMSVYLTPAGWSYVVTRPVSSSSVVTESEGMQVPGGSNGMSEMSEQYRLDVVLSGASGAGEVFGIGQTDGRASYYSPRISAGVEGVRSFRSVIYRDVYPGIDLVFHALDGGMKYEFVVRNEGDASEIRLYYTGATSLRTDAAGGLHITTPLGEIREDAPVCFTESEGARWPVPSSFELRGGAVNFALGDTGEDRLLVIDPCVHWSTFLGGTTSDFARDAVVDAAGNIVVSGYSSSADFPVTAGVLQQKHAGQIDAFVAKYTGNGRRLWTTFYGGSGSEEWPSVDIGPRGAIALSGFTSSPDFPVTPDAMQPVYAGNTDAFVVLLDESGRRTWATYLGGSYGDEAADIAFDPEGNLLLCGTTYSTNFPVSSGAYQTSNAGDFDSFVAKLGIDGKRIWITYYGGWSMEYATGIGADARGDVYVAGYTEGRNFPVSDRSTQTMYGGGTYDAFALKFSASGQRLWATYLGGQDEDKASRLAVDAAGNCYIAGYTMSREFPVTPNAFQSKYGGQADAFLVKIGAKGERVWSTYYGGSREDHGLCVAVNGTDGVLLGGFTESPDFPISKDALQPAAAGGSDAVLVSFTAAGERRYSSRYGGGKEDLGFGVCADAEGNAVLVGVTSSEEIPMHAATELQPKLGGIEDAFIRKLILNVPIADAGQNRVVCQGSSLQIEAKSGGGIAPLRYEWSPPEGLSARDILNPVATPKASIAYMLTVTDATGCQAADTLVLTVLPLPRAEAGTDAEICPGLVAQLGNPSVANPALTFAWSPPEGLSATDIAAPKAAPRTSTFYVLTITDENGCKNTDTVLVTVRIPPKVEAGIDRTICPDTPVEIGSDATYGRPPYVFSWQPAAGLDDASIARPRASPTVPTTYIVTVTDANGCAGTDTVRLSLHPRVTVDAGGDQFLCAGASAKLGGKARGGKTPLEYRWVDETGVEISSSASAMVSPRATMRYFLVVTDAHGCSSRDSVLVTVYDPLIAMAGEDVEGCAGSVSTLGMEARGGRPPYEYNWSPGTGLDDPRVARPTVTPSSTKSYRVTVRDANGCAASDTVTVYVNEPPEISIDNAVSLCEGSSVSIGDEADEGTPPYKYRWSPANGLSSETDAKPVARPTVTTKYVVTVTDAKGCTARDSVVVTVHQPPRVFAGHDTTLCEDQTMVLAPAVSGGSPPYTYEWSPSVGLTRTSIAAPALTARQTQSYILTVTDDEGCTAADTLRVTMCSKPRGDAGPDVETCPGRGVAIGREASGGTGPYEYSWSPTDGLNAADVASPLAAPANTQRYTLTVKDANGCVSNDAVEVRVHPPLTLSAGRDLTICPDGQAVLKASAEGGKKPYSFAWSQLDGTGVFEGSTNTVQPRTATAYVVNAVDATGCERSDTVIVSIHAPLVLELESRKETCAGSPITLETKASGGMPPYTVSWSPRDGLKSPKSWQTDAVPRSTTTYTALLTDAAGCAASERLTVIVHPNPEPRIEASGPLSFCDGGSVTLDAGAGYSRYEWSGGAVTRTITLSESGTASVVVYDTNGCKGGSSAASVKKKPNPDPVIRVKGPTSLCPGSSTVLDAGPGYASYRWNTGAVTRTLPVSESGTYSVTVTSGNGCSASSDSVAIGVLPGLHAVLRQSADTLTASEGARYRWFMNGRIFRGANARTLIVRKSGTYKVEVTNDAGCTAFSESLRVVVPGVKKKKNGR